MAPFHYLAPVLPVLMFIRAIRNRLIIGRPRYSYRLVRSTGKDGKVRQTTLLGLGTDSSLLRSLWPHVTRPTGDAFSG